MPRSRALAVVGATIAGLALAFTLGSGVAKADETDPRIEALRHTPAALLDPALPPILFGEWLPRELPKGAAIQWETNDCGEQTGDPALDAGRDFPTCVGVHIDVPSRARMLYLLFDPEGPAFVLGALMSPEAYGDVYFEELGLLSAMLDQALALVPLDCPEGATLVVEPSYAGSFESCRRGEVPDGPYRSWFNTGLYLMDRGTFAAGAKTGRWTECDRFERCATVEY